ncbi:MAG TPA: hypothetical protein VFW52_01460 [Candidatus Saccharimonadales bacterium]|nr:hypothetical protein [Candidatus Saccharimonadales bacterium]
MDDSASKKSVSLELAIDVFTAVKRALRHQGRFRRRVHAARMSSRPTAEKPTRKLSTVTMKSHEVLFKANTVFPFTLFTDTVVLDREKVSFINRGFFGVARITSVPVRDILSVEADIGPFFGSVHTSSRFYVTNPKSISWLRRRDAEKLQRMLQGYIIAHEQDINCDNIDKNKLIIMLHDLGTSRVG